MRSKFQRQLKMLEFGEMGTPAIGSPTEAGVVARRISRVKFGLYQPDHAVFLEERTESGRPAPSMRFRTATPMAASVR